MNIDHYSGNEVSIDRVTAPQWHKRSLFGITQVSFSHKFNPYLKQVLLYYDDVIIMSSKFEHL